MKQLTSLGRLFSAHGISNWEEIFPQEICEKCLRRKECKNQDCAAVKAIGGLAVIAVNRGWSESFITNLKEIIGSI